MIKKITAFLYYDEDLKEEAIFSPIHGGAPLPFIANKKKSIKKMREIIEERFKDHDLKEVQFFISKEKDTRAKCNQHNFTSYTEDSKGLTMSCTSCDRRYNLVEIK